MRGLCVVLGIIFGLTTVSIAEARQAQTGSIGFLESQVPATEADTARLYLKVKNIDEAFGPVELRIRVSATKETTQGFSIWYAGKLIASCDTYIKPFTFTLPFNFSAGQVIEVKPIQTHIPFTKTKKINLSIVKITQPTLQKGRKPNIGKSNCSVRLVNNYPYLTSPVIHLVPTTDLKDSSEVNVLAQAVLANSFEDSDSKLILGLTDSVIYSSFGAKVTIDTARNILYYDPSTIPAVPDLIDLGGLDSFWCTLKQKDAGLSKLQLYAVVGPRYARGMKFTVPFWWVDGWRTGLVDSTRKYPTGTKFLSYAMQSVKPETDPWFQPYDKGRDNQLYLLGEMTEFNFTYRYSVKKLKGGIGSKTVVLEPRAKMRLYGPNKVSKLRQSGYFFLDSGINNPSIQIAGAGMMITCHIPKYGKKKGKLVSYPAVMMVLAPPVLDTVLTCRRTDTGDSVIYAAGDAFSKAPSALIEYRKPGAKGLSTFALSKLYAPKGRPILLETPSGKIIEVPEKTEPGLGSEAVFKYPRIIPAAEAGANGTPRYDFLLKTECAISGKANVSL